MSRSIHTTHKELSKFSKKELDEMAMDPESPLKDLAEKSSLKKEVKRKRKLNK